MFEYFETDPERSRRFWGIMLDLGSGEGYNIKHLVGAYDWASLSDGATVVDVGGSVGHASIAIAEGPGKKLKFVVQHLEKLTARAEAQLPEKLKGQIDFMTHNFFTAQPVKRADVYLLRFILHDYSDKYSAKILQNIISAMKPGSKIVVMDGIMPQTGTIPKFEERVIRYVPTFISGVDTVSHLGGTANLSIAE